VMPVERNTSRKQWLAVVMLVIVGLVCARLGLWQLHRAGESRALQDTVAEAEASPPLDSLPDRASGDARFRRIELRGRYVPERQFLVDNIVREGRAGYYVLTPFDPVDSRRWIIVNRGWVPASPDRQRLPDVAVGADERSISGRLAPLPAPGLRLGETAPVDANDPLPVLSYPTTEDLEQLLEAPLFAYQLQLDAARAEGFERIWPRPAALTPSRHLAYVGQWWAFAAIAFGAAGVLALGGLGWRKR
jgi:surfeit locus 1 family protein